MRNFDSLFSPEQEKNSEPVRKIKKEIKNKSGETEIREFVSVGGIELEVNTKGRGTQYDASEFEDFAHDDKAMELLKIYAKAIKLNQPPLVEGPTDIGKSKALEYLAFLTNNHLLYQSFSGQTDVSELIGKYVPNTQAAKETFEKVLSAKNRGSLKNETLDILAQANENDRGLTEDECKKIAKQEGLNLGRVEWVWQDGTVPRAMEFNGGEGCWLYFDELGAAEPQILVKLNRIFSRGVRRIEITENGGKEVEAGDSFRLIATTNPPSYAGREPFEKDFLRRWVYQKVGNLSPEDFLKRLDFAGHGREKTRVSEAPVNLDRLPELDHILNDVISLFRHQAQEYINKLPRDAGEQEFSLADFTDALNTQKYLRELQGDDLLETLKDALEFYYLGKIDEDKKDANGKNVREKMREIIETIITQKKIKDKIRVELEKIVDPEILKKKRDFDARLKALEKKEASLIKLDGKKEIKPALTPDTLTAATPEGREIQINLKEQLKYWADFYKEENIDWVKLPDEINLTLDQIEQMQALMAEGFDKLLIIPEGLVDEPTITKNRKGVTSIKNPKYAKLHSLMSQGYKETLTWGDYDEDGKFEGSKDKTTKFRLILTKDVQNLDDDPLFKDTLNKSREELEKDELTRYSGFAESTYLIYQREYFKRTGKHLDEEGWIWLTESDRPLSGRVAYVRWNPGVERLRFSSTARDYHDGHLGCRLAGSFEIQI
jgi:MoxR-like ATPase